jgi:hypothetical protein
MSGGRGVELAEALYLLDPHAVMAGEVEQRIQQHGAMAGGQHEPVAIRPAWVGGIELVEAAPERGRHVGHAHRHAGMAGFRRFHRVDRQRADGVGHLPGLGRWPGQDLRLVGEHRVLCHWGVKCGHVPSIGCLAPIGACIWGGNPSVQITSWGPIGGGGKNVSRWRLISLWVRREPRAWQVRQMHAEHADRPALFVGR